MPASTVPRIPQEIINIIIEKLSAEKTILRACSVVSSSFRGPAQAHLFRSITINLNLDDEERNEHFRIFLTARPRICSYVQWLVLRLPDPEAADLLLPLLPKLTNVCKLNLIGGVGGTQNDWASFSNPFKAAFLQLLWLPSLHRLELNYTNFPFPYLRFCTHLKSLVLLHRLYGNPLKAEDTPEPSLSPLLSAVGLPNRGTQQGYLQNLDMGNWVALQKLLAAVQHPTSTLSLERLESFNSRVGQPEDITEIQNLLALSRPSLRRLSFNISLDTLASPRPMPSLQALPKLERLQFSIDWMQAAHSSRWMCQRSLSATSLRRSSLLSLACTTLRLWIGRA